MMADLILDKTGRAPNFVVVDDVLRHQPTGIEVPVRGRSDEEVRDAMDRLRKSLRAAGFRNPKTAHRNRSG